MNKINVKWFESSTRRFYTFGTKFNSPVRYRIATLIYNSVVDMGCLRLTDYVLIKY